METFIYALIDPRNKQVRYVGKSNNPKGRLNGHLKDKMRTHKANWIKKLLQEQLKPELLILDKVLESEWQFWEVYYIDLYKSWGFSLTNGNGGGYGMLNCTKATRRKMRIAKLGKPGNKLGYKASAATIEKNRLAKLGTKASLETKIKMSLASKGKQKSKEHKISISKAKKGKPGHVAWNKGRSHSPETLEKLKRINKKNMTSEKKKRISHTVSTTWERKKGEGFMFKVQREVKQIDPVTNLTIKIWKSCKEAELFYGVRKGADNIASCARKERNIAYKYKWEY